MKGFPPELVYILIFAAVLLFNFAMQKVARRQQEAEAAQQEPLEEQIPEAVWRGEPPVTATFAPPAVAVPRRRAQAPAPPPARRRRRFDRRSLFGSPRAIQDAIVAATILGRCRADEPHEVR